MHNERTIGGVDDTDLVEVPGVVGTDERDQRVVKLLDADRVVERVANGLDGDAVLVGAWRESWLIYHSILACHLVRCKLACEPPAAGL